MLFRYIFYGLLIWCDALIKGHSQYNSAPKPVMIFQAVDESFLPLWLNWWAVAKSFNAFPPNWTLYLACFGDKKLDEKVKKFHSPGCNQMIGGEVFIKHVYLAKWMAVTTAFKLGHDLLIIDLDSILIRNPQLMLPLTQDWDIIASRDHGPGNLPFSGNWGNGRLCTGFIFIKYSQAMLELVELVLRRCKKYGHDQIQFNSAVARAGVAWHQPPEQMNDDEKRHAGYFIWQHQYELDFLGFNGSVNLQEDWKYLHKHSNVLEAQGKSFANFSILMLERHDILRYCTSHPSQLSISDSIKNNIKIKKQIIALHCFINQGPVGEQGLRKKEQKQDVMRMLNYWLLCHKWSDQVKTWMQPSSTPIYSNPKLDEIIDKVALQTSKNLWLL